MKKTYLLLLALTGCVGSVGETKSSESQKLARANLKFSIEGVNYQGSALVQRRTSQKISVSVPEKAVKLVFTTCHREEVWDNPAPNWNILFQPTMWIENWGSCLITISVITQKGNLQQAIIDFTSNETLPATNYCNGKSEKMTGGASFCQARAGLFQRIGFDSLDVEAEPGEGCTPIVKDGYNFQYQMSQGLCTYAFRSKDGKGTHRLDTRGYTVLEAE